MKNKYKLLSLLFLIASCKYEDGPLFSLSSPFDRIVGYYEVNYVTENGIDQIQNIENLNVTFFHIGAGDDQHGEEYYFSVRIADTITYASHWFLSEDKEDLVVDAFGCGGFSPPDSIVPYQPLPGFTASSCIDSRQVWKITKLTEKKLWLESDNNGNHYEVHLNQIKSE